MSQGKTLMVYATKGGTTEEYANVIAVVLRDNKWQVDVVNLKKNRNPDLTSYRNVIVGSGIKMQACMAMIASFWKRTSEIEKWRYSSHRLNPKTKP